jgi:hypothetical protein
MSLLAAAAASGAFAAVVAVGVTLAIERFGGIVGGVLATLPTTIVPTSVAIAIRMEGQAEALERAMYTVSAGMLVNAAFLSTWRFLPASLPSEWSLTRRLSAMMGVSYAVWLLLAAAVVVFQLYALPAGASLAFGLACYGVLLTLGLWLCATPLKAPPGKARVPLRQLALRGALAGASIFVAVLLSSVNGVVAGMASTFPAIFGTSMLALWLAQGEAVPLGATGPMVLGSCAVPGYALIYVALLHSSPSLGPYGAAAAAWPLAVAVTSAPTALFLRWRRGVAAAVAQAAADCAGESQPIVAEESAKDAPPPA